MLLDVNYGSQHVIVRWGGITNRSRYNWPYCRPQQVGSIRLHLNRFSLKDMPLASYPKNQVFHLLSSHANVREKTRYLYNPWSIRKIA